ncbi:MAG: ClpXP protease specificity-enhancing factor SspB [Myxococcota bacterium]|nr:ClpXP protease specificity-enhancing factor SspB [Myxococcota bacterium]
MYYGTGVTDRETPPPKKDVARALLLRGSVLVHLDPRTRGVVVPPWLAKQPQLVLQVGLDLPVPIPDLRVDDEGVFGTLSFNRSPFTCSVPWDAVFALFGEDGMGMVWPEDLPTEIADEVQQAIDKSAGPKLRSIEGGAGDEPPKSRPARPHLRSVPPPEPEEKSETPSDEPPEPDGDDDGSGLPPYLRVIK